MSKMSDYIVNGGDEKALHEAQLEHMGGCLGFEIEENERLRALIEDACKVFEHYDLPEHAFHYRRAILGLDKAKEISRAASPKQPGDK